MFTITFIALRRHDLIWFGVPQKLGISSLELSLVEVLKGYHFFYPEAIALNREWIAG